MSKKEPEIAAERPSCHYVGIFILAVGTLGFLTGFASPYWHFSRGTDGTIHVHGLWTVCEEKSGTLSHCRDNIIRAEDWQRVVQALQSIACLLLLLACVLAVRISFSPRPSYLLLLDFAAGFGAVFAIFGTLAYLLFTLSPPTGQSSFLTFNWAFGINATGSCFCALGAILTGASRACVTRKIRKEKRSLRSQKSSPRSEQIDA